MRAAILVRGLLLLALLGLGAGPAMASAWDDAYQAGMKHLRAGENADALASFEGALKANPTSLERANTLYLMAATHFQQKDMKAAADLLTQIISLHDSGGFDDQAFFRAVLMRAALVAHEMDDEKTSQALQDRVADLDAHNPAIWDIDAKADSYRHKDTGITYPASVAGFKRERISVFRADGSDVGGDYHLETKGGAVTITVYATENYPLTAQQHLHSAIQSLRAEMNLPDKVDEGVFAPWGKTGPQGVYQIYRASGGVVPLESGLYVVAKGNTHFSVRVSYPAAIADEAKGAVGRFMAAFAWPKQ